MTTGIRNPSPRNNRFNTISGALRPGRLIPALVAGLLIGMLEIALAASFATLIFGGDMSTDLFRGIGMALFAATIGIAVTSLLTSLPSLIGGLQSAPSAVVGVMAAGITALVIDQEARTATIIAAVALTTLTIGLFLFGLGVFRLGGLVRFLPYPVAGGFLASTGWLLIVGAISTMARLPFSFATLPALLEPRVLLLWLPGLALGLLVIALSNRFRHYLFMPLMIGVTIAGFYLVAALLGMSPAALSDGGWLLGPFPVGRLWQPVSAAELSAVQWSALLPQLPNLVGAVIITTIALLLNATALELILNRDIDLNHEMRVAGLANLASGTGGGLAGFGKLSMTVLAGRLGAAGRLAGFIAAALCGMTLWVGGSALAFVPTIALGTLLAYLGFSFLWEWVVDARARLSRIDYLIVLLILTVTAVAGFLQGIVVGIVATIAMFVVNYSRTDVVRHELSGSTFRSRVTRKPEDLALLEVVGDQAYFLKLHGFIFFGTAHRLLEQVRARVRNTATRYVVIDFHQVIGVDSTALLSFIQMRRLSRESGFTLVFSALSPKLRHQFERGGLIEEETGSSRFVGDIDRAAEWCEDQFCLENAADKTDRVLSGYFLALMPDSAAGRLVGYMERREVAAGDYLIRQGAESDHLFFVESGQVTAQLESPDATSMRLETMQGGRVVGELGFYLGTRRSAAVVADQPSVLYRMSQDALARIEKDDPEAAYVFHRIIIHLLGERVLHLVRTVEALQV